MTPNRTTLAQYEQRSFRTLVFYSFGLEVLAALLWISGWILGLNRPYTTAIVVSVVFTATIMGVLATIVLLNRERNRTARRVYLASQILMVEMGVLAAPQSMIALCVLGIGHFVLLATFLEPPRIAALWGIGSGISAVGLIELRRYVPILDIHGMDQWFVVLIMPLLIAFFVLLGRIPNEEARKAIRDSDAVFQQLHDLVAERTSDLQHALGSEAWIRQLILSLGHDLKAPINKVDQCVGTLIDLPDLDPTVRWLVQGIDEACDVLHRRTWTMLDIARTRMIPTTKTTLGVQAIIDDMLPNITSSQRAYRSEHIAIVTTIPPTATVCGDLPMLSRALENLVVNSLKAQAGQPSGQIRITYAHTSTHDCLRVDDDGPGFPQERLVSRWYTKPTERQRGAHGLGLIGVQIIMDTLGGTLTLDNRPDGGAQVMLALPRTAYAEDSACTC